MGGHQPLNRIAQLRCLENKFGNEYQQEARLLIGCYARDGRAPQIEFGRYRVANSWVYFPKRTDFLCQRIGAKAVTPD